MGNEFNRESVAIRTADEESSSLVCIRCPMGCRMTVTKNADGTLAVAGNTCNRGAEYAVKELTNPMRIVTSTVRVKNGRQPVVSVKTKRIFPKEKSWNAWKL